MVKIKTKEEISAMRRAGQLAAQVLAYTKEYARVGVSTEELNILAHEYILKNKAIPAPLNYGGFPKSICTSINDVVCHGIPSKFEILASGDILNIDITVILDGFHGDVSETLLIGEVKEDAKLLVQRTKQALYLGIEAVRPGAYLYEVGRQIENYVRQFGYSVVRDFGGHGIGRAFHEDPHVHHYYNKQESNIKLQPGMIFTIEPMINLGGYETVVSEEDNWTAKTQDGSLSAQFEHTVLVTEEGYEILTKCFR